MSIQTSNVTTTGNAVYTSSGNTAVTWLSICNFSNSTVVANVYVVPNGSSLSNTNIVLASLTLASGGAGNAGGDTYQVYSAGEKLLLGNGDAIWINANANTSLTAVTSYTTI